MSSDLLEREAEFHKLNKQLEKRTQELLHEVDTVIKYKNINEKQNFVCSEEKNDKKESRHSKSGCLSDIKVKSPSYDVEKESLSDILPSDVKNIGTQGLLRFLQAKVKKQSEEIKLCQTKNKQIINDLRKTQTENKQLQEISNKVTQQIALHKEQITKQEEQINYLNGKLHEKDTENISLKKELDNIKKDFKSTTSGLSNNEQKLNRALEEIKKFKLEIKKYKQNEKDLCESNHKQINNLNVSIRKLEKQKKELTNAFKKQLLLIDNLKKQKAHLEASKLIQISEDEFLKILDWNFQDTIILNKK